MSILGKHVGHTLHVLSDGRARCQDCSHTLDLRTITSTSTSFTPTNVNDPDRCLLHLDSPPCRGCAADKLAKNEELAL